jgi:hypothetical protein
MAIHLARALRWNVLVWSSIGGAVACSGGLDADADGPPAFGGGLPRFADPVNSGTNGLQPDPNAGTSGAGAPNGSASSGQGAESQGSGAPLDNTNTGASPYASNSAGAGGSASTPPANPAAGGSFMQGGAPADDGLPDGTAGAATLPPPVTPPPVTPPPVEPPFEGVGCAPGAAFFCEDFESFNVGPAQANAEWAPSVSNGSLSIDGAVARDARALHVQTQGNGRAYMVVNGFAPPNNSFFARMYLQAQAFPTAPDYAHFTLVEATGVGAGLIRPIGGQYIPGQGTVALWGAGSDGGPTGDWTNWRPTTPTEAGRWVCIEWEMNSADNNINVWIEGVAKPELSVSTSSHGGNNVPFVFPRFNSMWIGWQLYQGGPTPNQFSLRFDDIVLSTQRVGC